MKLIEMNAEQAMAHYEALIRRRMVRAAEERVAVWQSPADVNTKRRLQRKVDKAVERAHKMSFKGQWQVAAAADLYQRYGVNVAVGFLRAYGWQHSPDLYYQVTGKVMRGCC